MRTLTAQGPSRRVVILHYSAPPVVGGVESTIYHHARLLLQAGYQVEVVAGRGQSFFPGVAFHVLPELDSRHPDVLAVKRELDQGLVSAAFHSLCERIVGSLRPYLAAADVLIAHNVFTLHKNLPLTAALHRLLAEEALPSPRTLAWHHDLAWHDPQYAAEVHPGYPWELLRQSWPGVVHVAVSEPRRAEVTALYGIPLGSVAVVPPGIDPALFFRWTTTTRRIVDACHLLDADVVLLLPARITRRKNVQLAVRALAALRERTGLDARLIVTGPPGPHNPSNLAYLEELVTLRRDLGLAQSVHFLSELDAEQRLVPDEATMSDLYLLADALIFPSQEEGFGIPILEAGLVRLPVFCSRIPALQATGESEVHYFSPDAAPEAVAALIADGLLRDPAFCLRRRVLQRYLWERILEERILPLLEGRHTCKAQLP